MGLDGKVALITGAGRGLGRAAALAMAREGADLVIVSRTPRELEETASLIIDMGGKVAAVSGDVAKGEEIKRIVETALETFHGIDILMNNAAVVTPMKPCHEITADEWRDAMDVNLNAPRLLSAVVVPIMIGSGGGKIINVTSGLADIVLSPFGPYSVAKAGLNQLTRLMAWELKKYNIQVNGLDPGLMDTRMQEEIRAAGEENLGAAVHRRFMEYMEKGMLAPPANLAQLALFLASAESDHITGEIGGPIDYARFGYRYG